MGKINKHNDLEKSLIQKYKDFTGEKLYLSEDDFKNEKLTSGGYSRIKEECSHFEPKKEIEIQVPAEHQKDFKDNLEYFSARELIQIRKDIFSAQVQARALFFIGMIFLLVGYFVSAGELFKEIIVIASWVFIWAAVEKMFFDTIYLRRTRVKILQMLSAKITAENDSTNK